MQAFLLGGARTPFANQGQSLGTVEAEELASAAVHHTLRRCDRNVAAVSGVVVATDFHAVSAHRILRAAFADRRVPLLGVVGGGLASGLAALMLAAHAVASDEMNLVLVLGCDSASTAPHFLPRSTLGARLGHGDLLSTVQAVRSDEIGELPAPPARTRRETDASGIEPSASITTGSHRKPIVVDEDEDAQEEWAPGDGAVALLIAGFAAGATRLDRFACAATVSSARAAAGEQLPAFAPRADRPAPPGAAALASVLEAQAHLREGADESVALAGQSGGGYVAVRLSR